MTKSVPMTERVPITEQADIPHASEHVLSIQIFDPRVRPKCSEAVLPFAIQPQIQVVLPQCCIASRLTCAESVAWLNSCTASKLMRPHLSTNSHTLRASKHPNF